MWPFTNITDRINRIIQNGADTALTDEEFILRQINEFKSSRKRKDMIDGERYFMGQHDIKWRKRMAIGDGGELEEVTNLPNNRIVDNQYKRMVKQKYNYLTGQPLTLNCDNDEYLHLLEQYFDMDFMRTLKYTCKSSLNQGIGWMMVYYDSGGKLSVKRINSFELVPVWADTDHTQLEMMIRFYPVQVYEGKTLTRIIEKVEVYTNSGIMYYVIDGSKLMPAVPYYQSYFSIGETPYNWTKIPFVPFKYNETETTLLQCCKSLQDAMNLIESNFQNQMEEEPRNSIMVLVNYDGENLGEFRRQLSTFSAVKIRDNGEGGKGDVRTLEIPVNAENYKSILDIFKRAIIENCMGYDAKDDRLGGQPNQMNIQSMYQDMDLDANDMETEYQASMEQLMWFLNCHFANTGKGDFFNERVKFIFNRDMMMNEGEVIDNINNSIGILSTETLVSQHPWVDSPQGELDRLKKEQEEQQKSMYDPFSGTDPPEGGDG